MTVVNMVAPAGVNLAYGLSGTQYNPGASGVVQVDPEDVVGLISAGWQTVAGNVEPNASGLVTTVLPLTHFKNAAGTTIAATAASGVFGISNTPGTSGPMLTGEVANDATVTDNAVTEFILPANYIAGQNLTVEVDCQYTNSSGTLGTHTIGVNAYLGAEGGGQGSNLGLTSAQSIAGTTAGKLDFTIDGASLAPGGRLLLEVEAIMETTTSGSATAEINEVTIG